MLPTDVRELWLSAIQEDLDSLGQTKTWKRDDSSIVQALQTHVVLKVKRNSDGTVERLMPALLLEETTRHMDMTTLKRMLPLCHLRWFACFSTFALCLGMCIGQVDVKTASLMATYPKASG